MNLNNENSEGEIKEEVDINLIISFFIRNKKLISAISFVSFFIACIYSFTLKKIWEGQFQIVIRNNSASNSKNFTSSDPLISSFFNSMSGGNIQNDILTEVGI